jgi:hypothetical protein
MFLANLKTVDMFLEPKVRTGRIVDMFLTAILRTGGCGQNPGLILVYSRTMIATVVKASRVEIFPAIQMLGKYYPCLDNPIKSIMLFGLSHSWGESPCAPNLLYVINPSIIRY